MTIIDHEDAPQIWADRRRQDAKDLQRIEDEFVKTYHVKGVCRFVFFATVFVLVYGALNWGCASTKQPIVFERPKVSVVYPSYQAAPWQSLGEINNFSTLAYFQFQGAYSYKIAYLTLFGKIPFKQKEVSSGRTNDFWPSVLTDFKYEGDPSRLVFVAKDTVYATPCYVKVQAWDGEKWSEWSELIKVE